MVFTLFAYKTSIKWYSEYIEQLFVPVLNGLKVSDNGNPQTVLLAEGHGFAIENRLGFVCLFRNVYKI